MPQSHYDGPKSRCGAVTAARVRVRFHDGGRSPASAKTRSGEFGAIPQ
jgi:hypothetical protein